MYIIITVFLVVYVPNLTITIPLELYRRLKKHPEIRWSVVIRRYLEEFLRKLEAKFEEETTSILKRLGLEEKLDAVPDETALAYGEAMVKKRGKRAVRQ